MQEETIQTKTCKHCNSNFEVTDKDLEFYDKISPVFNWKKYQIPTPTLCPNCRQQRRLSFRNERNLYKRKCDATGKNIISIYSPDKELKVYDQDFWWSDNWNSLDYWVDFDFDKPFFEQFKELMKKVPRCWILNWYNENSQYTNHWWKSKNCYLCVWFWHLEDCFYSSNLEYCKNVSESDNIFNSENCYECFYVEKTFWSKYVYYSKNIINSFWIYNCDGCEYCIWCVNLSNKKYYIFNKKSTPEEYKNFIDWLNNYSQIQKFLEEFFRFKNTLPHKNLFNHNTTDSIWDWLTNTKNCYYCFDGSDLENIKYWYEVRWNKNCYDVSIWWENPERIYEWHCITWTKILFWTVNWWWNNLIYCDNSLWNSKDCFWCISLKNNQYCILNKQYTKQEYNELVSKIIEHMQQTWEWWEFFPSSISPFWYNETVAQEYFPLTPPSVPPLSGEGSKMFQFSLSPGRGKMSEGQIGVFNWSDHEPPKPNVEKIIPANKLPENIKDIPDDILNWAIMCETTQKPFRIIKQELDFYRKHNLPIPRKHPDQRHLERMQLRNPRKLFDRKCDKCEIEIKTTYSPDRPEIVYCEKCYEKEVC